MIFTWSRSATPGSRCSTSSRKRSSLSIDEWYKLLCTYNDGVLSWVGGSEKVEGTPPSDEAVRQRLFLIRYSLEKLFPGQDSFPCTWTYLTCRR